jgi:hypothetical protein
MASAPPAAGFVSTSAPLQGRDASAGTVEKEYEKEFFAHRSYDHSLDKIRKAANLGSDQMVCGARSEPARDAEAFSVERYHPVVPEAMRLEQLDPFSGPSTSCRDVSNPIEWEQVLARAPDPILAGAHELGSAPDRMARGDAPEPFHTEITEITVDVETTEVTVDVEMNPAAGERGGAAATLRDRNDDVGTNSEARAIEGHSGADGKKSGCMVRVAGQFRNLRPAEPPLQIFAGPAAPQTTRVVQTVGGGRCQADRRRNGPMNVAPPPPVSRNFDAPPRSDALGPLTAPAAAHVSTTKRQTAAQRKSERGQGT